MSVDVVLVGCAKSKRRERCAARDMYDPSDLFRRRRQHAEASGLPWLVLSARYGTLDPDYPIDPYDFTIDQRRTSLHAPRQWAIACLQHCYTVAGRTTVPGPSGHRVYVDPLTIEVHAGVDYVRTLELGLPAFSVPPTLTHPVRGLGIGEQKAWYAPADGEPAIGEQTSLGLL